MAAQFTNLLPQYDHKIANAALSVNAPKRCALIANDCDATTVIEDNCMSIAKNPTKDGKKITITFYIKKEAAAGADKIFLICEHNGWEPVAMKPQKNGTFRGSITVPIDIQPSYQYRFKYIMNDGEVKFDNDWDAESYCRNDFGTENSVFTVQHK